MRDKVLVPSSRMLARIRLTSQLWWRGDEASWHRRSRWTAMAVIEMAFAREEENVIRGGGSDRRDVAGRGGGSGAASNGDSRPTATQSRWPRAGGRNLSKQRGWGDDVWAPWHSSAAVKFNSK
jgi:hypothetical protein